MSTRSNHAYDGSEASAVTEPQYLDMYEDPDQITRSKDSHKYEIPKQTEQKSPPKSSKICRLFFSIVASFVIGCVIGGGVIYLWIGQTQDASLEGSNGSANNVDEVTLASILTSPTLLITNSLPTTSPSSSCTCPTPKTGADVEIPLGGKNTSQSSQSNEGVPERAVDGNTNGNYVKERSCTHTREDQDGGAWWMIDLENSFRVDKVAIYNRNDCCPDRLNGTIVRIGDDPNRNNPICSTVTTQQVANGPEIILSCDMMVGQYLSIELPTSKPLTLCEVKLYGNEYFPTTIYFDDGIFEKCSCAACYAGPRCESVFPGTPGPLGLEKRTIEDHQMSASSELANDLAAHKGRLNNLLMWASSDGDLNRPWLQVDFLGPVVITGIQTQGAAPDRAAQWVTSVQVQYGNDINALQTISENGSPKSFGANVNQDDIKQIYFPESFVARYLRVVVTGKQVHPSMRMEVLGYTCL